MKYIELQSERLIFRKFKQEDFPVVYDWLSNLENMKYRSSEPKTEQEAHDYLDWAIKCAEQDECVNFRYAVELKDTGELIGSCELYSTDKDPAELAWELHRSYWRKGYGTEIGKTLLKLAFDTLKLRRVIADCNTLNTGSYRIMEKIGMRREAHFVKLYRGNSALGHEWCDKYQYAILREEWENSACDKMKKEIDVTFEDLEWLYSQDWEYFDYGNCKRHLQVIMPYRRLGLEKKYPVIFYIPGAAWHKQEMYNDIPKLSELAKKGFAVVSVEVRESDIAVFPAQIEDIKNAMECVRKKAEEFDLPFDIDASFIMGHSSGGHLAMMAVLFNAHGMIEMPPVKGVILESASSDILICAGEPLPPWMTVRPSTVLLGVDSIEGNEEIARKASCVYYINSQIVLPPVLLFHSENDPVVSVENSRTLYGKLERENHKVYYYEMKNCEEHSGNIYYTESILSIIHEFINNNTLN